MPKFVHPPLMAKRTNLKSRFPEIAAELRPRVSREVKQGAEEIADKARRNLESGGHVKSGELLNSIHVERRGPASFAVVADARADKDGNPGAGPYYGPFVEFGTADTAPYPFLHPAADEEAGAITNAIEHVLRSL